MKQYQGRKIKVFSINGECVAGMCLGATDEIVRIKVDGEPDARVVFIRNIYSYTVEGLGEGDGISGLRLFICRNPGVCPGIRRLAMGDITLNDMGCQVQGRESLKCDFGCVGNIEVIPSQVLRGLLNGMEIRGRIGEKKNG